MLWLPLLFFCFARPPRTWVRRLCHPRFTGHPDLVDTCWVVLSLHHNIYWSIVVHEPTLAWPHYLFLPDDCLIHQSGIWYTLLCRRSLRSPLPAFRLCLLFLIVQREAFTEPYQTPSQCLWRPYTWFLFLAWPYNGLLFIAPFTPGQLSSSPFGIQIGFHVGCPCPLFLFSVFV